MKDQNSITRWKPVVGDCPTMQGDSTGSYVRFEDHRKTQYVLRDKERKLGRASRMIGALTRQLALANASNARLEAQAQDMQEDVDFLALLREAGVDNSAAWDYASDLRRERAQD